MTTIHDLPLELVFLCLEFGTAEEYASLETTCRELHAISGYRSALRKLYEDRMDRVLHLTLQLPLHFTGLLRKSQTIATTKTRREWMHGRLPNPLCLYIPNQDPANLVAFVRNSHQSKWG